MQITAKGLLAIISGLMLAVLAGIPAFVHAESPGNAAPADGAGLPLIIAHQGTSPKLERPEVAFDHDRHTLALKQAKAEDCAVCHVLKETDKRLINPEVAIYRYPKAAFNESSKTATMYAYHQACVSCHRQTAAEGKKAGPDIGMCGKCHDKRVEIKKVSWAWSPVFNYARHAKHVQAAEKFQPEDELGVAKNVNVIGEVTGKKCETCHHAYDESLKTLIYKKDTENSCRACHKAKDEQNARSMQKVAHVACIGCHMKLAEKVKAELSRQGKTELSDEDKKRFGPFECKGCHGEHKELTPEELRQVPRLVRGQKDIIDVSLLKDPKQDAQLVRMKLVPFDHKAHEPRAQFCSTCHHNSLEKCVNCHTLEGDIKKGGGVSFERAFHENNAGLSCAGCHNVAKQDMKCAGCHRQQQVSLTASSGSCSVCHRGPSNGKPFEVAPLPVEFDKEKVPEKAVMKALEKEYKPAEMPHQKIIKKLTVFSNESSLARFFHAAKEQALCYGCHHNSQVAAANKFPPCGTCHTRPFEPKNPGKPGMMAAYHQQCMGCHTVMGQKPKALDCDKCHAAKEVVPAVQAQASVRRIPE